MKKLVYDLESKIRLVLDLTSEAAASFYEAWNQVLEEYWSCHLSYPSDVLVAMAGIAQMLEKRTGLTWIGGLRGKSFCQWTFSGICIIIPKHSALTPFLHGHGLAYPMDQSNCHYYAVSTPQPFPSFRHAADLSNQLHMKIRTPQG